MSSWRIVTLAGKARRASEGRAVEENFLVGDVPATEVTAS
ncbi:hypothetical protein PLANPX_3063 [Lacipirellula parvula]|uniref:Uncharacterized protein n=1 Tax=Lacipirellula parvula TaxID=2650471 RepID=A0A5K7XEZ5_9BACT|nr:hypothetical protein PLANPX_3063 [Lacipirellula parvula]